ncbi:uncharacterized protein LOC6557760 [Drosophila grimshawi]|uniref:GH15209 n=1 Tax=Drosophila grimshawi TaxID=7222 RepID=B4IXI5_DROGR|nr:uncharacterized protein LOC6557760 [Drosophila grimshawi]EDV96422.1 GH15209 [Drosophila grimshawi]
MAMLQKQGAATTELDPGSSGCCCNCQRKLDPYQLFDENVEDIAKSLAQIMVVCGINTGRAYNARSIIKRAFIYHEKLRTRCPANPPEGTHLRREDLLQALQIKCEMGNVEAMLTYAIIKRAFKAFFHGKPDRTISNPIVDAMAISTQKAAWMHAAYRTAKIFDNYRPAFFWAHKAFEKQINIVYRDLYERMSARANPLAVPNCSCPKCARQSVPGHPKPGERVREKFKLADCADLPQACIVCGLQVPKIRSNVKRPRPILNHESKFPRCHKCNAPRLICECNIDQLTGELYGECGQDSYKVKWYRLEQEQKPPPAESKLKKSISDAEESSYEDAKEPDWEDHHCPIDCVHNEYSESSNVCHEHNPTSLSQGSDTSFTTCSESEDTVDKLERYLNTLWAEELAVTNNPKTYVANTKVSPCGPCKRLST